MQNLKVVTVGDGAVGKSCLLIAYTTNSFPSVCAPVFDNCCANVMVNGTTYNISLWDTPGQEDYDRLRPLSYPDTDVFLVCFSVDNPDSLSNIKQKWLPELHHFAPGVPIILVATKTDLREPRSGPNSQECIPFAKGYKKAKKYKIFYMEISTLTQQGLKELFEKVVEVSTSPTYAEKKKGFNLFGKKTQKPAPIPPVMPPAEPNSTEASKKQCTQATARTGTV